ncbi:helix-turn-helix domain-containing protein, partial [Salimicrobium halophilum]
MSKYSEEFKLKVVREYLQGPLGYILLAERYSIPSETPIKNWVRAYKAFGEEGLKKRHSRQVYSVQFKLDVLNFKKQTGASHQETAIAFRLNNPSL